MSIKKGLKKGRKLLLAICLPVLAVAIVAAAVIGAVLGTDSNKRSPLGNLADSTSVTANSSTINLGNTKISSGSSTAVQSLIDHIAGSSSTYSALSTSMESWKGIGTLASTTTKTKVASQLSTKTVTLGGIVWNIMYVSKADKTANGTTAGDIIVTLWQAASDANYMSAYSGSTASNTPTDKYPSNMYGASLVRSTLVGSNYSVTRAEATLPSNGASTQNAHWKQFTTTSSATVNGYAEVLATPANMAWQEIQDPKVETGYSYHFPNEAYGTVPTGGTNATWYSANYNYKGNGSSDATVYSAWQNDKIWLPSWSETGRGSGTNRYGTTGSGLWDASQVQRQTGVTSGNAQYAWLRSGYYNGANFAYSLNSNGSNYYNLTTRSYAVRPALHLNLKSAAQAAGLLTQSITYNVAYGTKPTTVTSYTPGSATVLPTPTNIPAGLAFNGWAKDSYTGTTVIKNVSGQTGALNLYATYTLTAPTVTPTPSNKSASITYGSNATMSASLSHTFLTDSKATASYYWRYNSETTNLSTSSSYTLTKPAVSKSGTYTLYYTVTPTTAEKNKGVLAYSGNVPFTLTVSKANLTAATAPTISNKVYVGQAISSASLTGGSVKSSNTSEAVTGSWAITTTGNFTSTGAIKAKFTPTDTANYNVLNDVAITNNAEQLYLKMSESVTGVEGSPTAAAAQDIAVDYNTTPTFSINTNNKKVTFSVTQNGTAKSVDYSITAPAGYTAYLHDSGSSTALNAIGKITANKNLVVSYNAAQVGYTVYYILSNADTGAYPTPASITKTELDKLMSLNPKLVYKYDGTATTGSAVTYLNANNKPLNTTLANDADFARRTIDTAKTGTIGKVKGDGSTIALIYYRMIDRQITYHATYGTAPVDPDGKYIPGTDTTLMAVTNIPANLEWRGWAKGSYTGDLITTLTGQTTDLDLYATYKLKAPTVTKTPENGAVEITYGANATLSAVIGHGFISSGDAVASTYWRKSGNNTNLASGDGLAVVNGDHASLTFTKPPRSMAGTYVLYCGLTTTAAAKATGLFDCDSSEAARYTLTINKANLTVTTAPTITPPAGSDKIYIGQSISANQLAGGVVRCASANLNSVPGTWQITTTGVYTSYGKITAKFTPTDNENLNTLTGYEITTNAAQLYLTVSEDVEGLDIDGVSPHAAASIKVDYGSSIGFSASDDKFTFMVRQDGVENTVDYSINGHPGYTSFMHVTGDTEKEEITPTSEVLTNVTEGKLFTIAYQGADTEYTVYYILDGTDSDFPAADTAAALDALIADGSQYVYKCVLFGATGSRVKYMSNGSPLDPRVAARADIAQRVLDEQMTGEIKIVKNDGTIVQFIYLKLKTYTLTFAASGAAPSLQTIVCKYGTAFNMVDITEPQKDMSDFKGWFYDSDFENALVKTDKVEADTQLYAKFDTKHYKLVFDFNIGTGTNQLPGDDKTVVVNSYNLYNHKISWDVDRLFAESFGFGVSDGTGRYEIDYTVNNLTANKSITGIKPSAIGYTFNGWYTEGTNTQANVIRRPNASTEDVIVLVARWTPASYTMRFDKQDGSRITTKSVRNMSAWGEADTDLLPGATGAILPEDPKRTGYNFQGWYITTDEESEHFNSVHDASNFFDDNGNRVFSISDFASSGFYGSAAEGFNFGSLTVYAIWQSVDVVIETVCEHGELAFYRDDIELSPTDPVYINDTITVVVDVDNGYEFKNLSVSGRALSNGIVIFTVAERYVISEVDGYGEPYNYITVEAFFAEERYTIQYDTDGGKAADSTFARTYTASNIGADSSNRAKLPSLLTKRGFDFAGWIFKTTQDDPVPDAAFETDDDPNNLYGADLWLKKPWDDKFRDVTLKAVWTPQKAEVYLYNATYSGVYNKDTTDSSRYAISDFEGDDIVTDMTIEIDNPSRGESFVFLGWATTRNGSVVYPAEEGKDSVEYRVNPHKDEKGNLLNLNNLYAVWHVAGIDYVIMSATNNNCTYGGKGITMSAKPSRNYESDTSATITLNYKWYKIYEARYDECFFIKDYEDKDGYKWYLDESDNIVAYYKEGKYYSEDKTTEITKDEAEALGTKLTYKEFDPSSVSNQACVLKSEQPNKRPDDLISYNVKNVNDCGIYVCVVEVVATEQGGGSTTRSSAYGEVEIAMNKAVYDGLSMAKKKVTYNSTPRGEEISVSGLPVTMENGFKTITLPDGSKVNVNYTYFALGEDGVTRNEITDVNDIKNVGKYVVVASFSFAVNGDKGNYEELEELEAELTISADTLSMLEYGLVHGADKSTDTFSGAYDGTPYSIDVAIKDTLDINSGSVLVTSADDVYVVAKVYKVTENGDEEVTGDTIDAGTYAVVVIGLGGEAADNYILAGGLNLRKEYTITKRVYDVAGHIGFNDTEVVFDNELHAISVKVDAGYELPSTVTVTYSVEYSAEEEDFTEGKLSNETKNNNGGRYAGVYTVTVKFTDSASDNYEELESMTATLTIKKAKFFEFYNKDGVDLLRDAGFVNGSFSYIVNKKYNPHISGTTLLSDSEHFSITYEYYRVSETQRDRTMLGSGTYDELLAAGNLISLAGKYEIVALIKYESALYRNNFEEIDESESTIIYVIRIVNVESVEVVAWADGFNMEAKLGSAFDYSWIKQINVTYAGTAGTLEVTSEADIALAGVTLEKKDGADQTTFWHTGVFKVKVSFYGTESEAYEFAVKEEVQNAVLKYGTGSEYAAVPEEGLEMLTDGTAYSFIIEYRCTDDKGEPVTRTSEVSVAAGGLVLGKNVLTANEDYYVFADVLTVEIYKVIKNVIWEYSLDGNTWNPIPDSGELVYAGAEYMVRGRFEDGGTQYCEAYTDSGLELLNANANGYLMQIGRSGNYKVTAEFLVVITKKVLEFTWDTAELEYNTWHRSPKVVTSGLEEADIGLVTFGYEFYVDGVLVTTDRVVGAGEYEVSVVLRGDATVRNNYTLEGSATATYKFEIVKANIQMSAVYSESNYGENITFAGNPQGLRRGAMKPVFGENAVVKGEFTFITDYVEATGEYEVVEDEKQLASLIANQGYATVWYLYEAEDENYNLFIGSITINVLGQTAKSGAGALYVELGNDAVPFYLLNQEFDTHGIVVYKLYESTYLERGTWYGLRTKIENPSFRIGNMAAQGYKITSADLANEKVVLRALSGSDSGTLDVPVVEKTPTKLEVSSTNHKTIYYVGETPDFDDIEFRVLFGLGENPQEGLKVGAVKTTFNQTITQEGTFTVEFTYYNVSCEVTFTAKAKEELQIVKPVNTVLTYKGGEVLDVPEIGFTVDGVKYGQNALDGVTVKVAVYKDGKLTNLVDEGEYTVRYSFEITNPRFSQHSYVDVQVTVTKNPYKVDITVTDGESAAYTGEPIAIPMPVVGAVTDSTDGDAELPANRVSTVYTVNGKEVDINKASDWLVGNRGTYEVEITVKVLQSGSEPYTVKTVKYTFTVTQAENDQSKASVEAKNVVLGENANFNFKVTADFGANTAVLEYGMSRDGVYTTDKPTTAGTYFVRAQIAETNNYKGLTTIAVPFEVRNPGIDAGESGSISGGNGTGADWQLEINQINAEDLSKESIAKQNVLDGYEVVLKNGNGVAVSGEGEYTVRIKLSEELNGRKDLNVYFVDADGNATKLDASVNGEYVSIKMSTFDGRVIITNAQPKEPVGLLVAVIILGVIAAVGVTLCIIIFFKKKKKGGAQ